MPRIYQEMQRQGLARRSLICARIETACARTRVDSGFGERAGSRTRDLLLKVALGVRFARLDYGRIHKRLEQRQVRLQIWKWEEPVAEADPSIQTVGIPRSAARASCSRRTAYSLACPLGDPKPISRMAGVLSLGTIDHGKRRMYSRLACQTTR